MIAQAWGEPIFRQHVLAPMAPRQCGIRFPARVHRGPYQAQPLDRAIERRGHPLGFARFIGAAERQLWPVPQQDFVDFQGPLPAGHGHEERSTPSLDPILRDYALNQFDFAGGDQHPRD